MLLTDQMIKNARPGPKPVKLIDGNGLFLLVQPNGSRWWRMRFRFDGLEKQLSFGVYPLITLKRARERRDELRRQVAEGINPSAVRRAEKLGRANTFEAIAREWMDKRKRIWSAEYAFNIARRLEQHVFPWIGRSSIAKLTAADVLEVPERIERRGKYETAHRARANCADVFRFAVCTRRAERDVTMDLKGALMPVHSRHYPSVKRPEQVGQLLRAIDSYDAKALPVRAALRLLPLVFVRPGELRLARWHEFDLGRAVTGGGESARVSRMCGCGTAR